MIDAIATLATGTYNVTRPGAGAWANGVFVEGAPSTFPITAVVWPASGEDLERLPQGESTSSAIALITATELRTAKEEAGTLSDRIAYSGETYEVEHVEPWEAGGFWKALARQM